MKHNYSAIFFVLSLALILLFSLSVFAGYVVTCPQGSMSLPGIGCWGQDQRFTFSPKSSFTPSIVVHVDNAVSVVWKDDRNGAFDVFYKMVDSNSQIFVKQLTHYSANYMSDNPAIALSPDGNEYVVWQSGTISQNIMFKKIDPYGKSLTREIDVSGTTPYPHDPELAVDRFGNAHIVWYATPGGGSYSHEVFYRKIDRFGNYMTPAIMISQPSESVNADNPTIDVDSQNNLHVAWARRPSIWDYRHAISYRKLDNNGNYLSPLIDLIPIVSGPTTNMTPTIALGDNGDIHLLWVSIGYLPPYVLNYGKFDKNGIANSAGIALGYPPYFNSSYHHPIVIDNYDNVRVAWAQPQPYNGTNFEIFYGEINSFGIQSLQLTYNPANSFYPSLAIGKYGSAHIVWEDYRDGNPEIYYKQSS